MTPASFRKHKNHFGENQISVDKFGNKIGFGGDQFHQALNYNIDKEYQSRLNMASRGTILRMMSDGEEEINAKISPNVGLKGQRNLSQPNFPTSTAILRNIERKSSNPSLPALNLDSKNRITTPGYVGEEAYSNFYKKYRRLSKEREIWEEGYSATTAYLTSWQKMQIAPTPFGLLKWEGNENEINASNYLMGRKYALALSNSMKYLKTEKLNLRSNNLGTKGTIAILANLPETLTELDISKNDMGDSAMSQLVSWLNFSWNNPKN